MPRTEQARPAPLSFGQRLIWLHSQLAPDVPLYNEPWTVHFVGDLDVRALEQAINEFVGRHEAWRTVFPVANGEPVQHVQPPSELVLNLADLRQLPSGERHREAALLAAQDARTPFDLSHGPLLRLRLVRLEDEYHRLYLTLHHVIFDGFSIYRIFLPEVAQLYDAFRRGLPSPLKDVPVQQREYANRQVAQWNAGEGQARIAYWRKQLSDDVAPLQLPTTFPRGDVQTFAGAMCRVAIPGDLRDHLRRIGASEGATLFMVLLAAFELQLYLYSGQHVFRIGSVTAGRNHPEAQSIVGYCLNTIVLRADLCGRPTFRELLRRVRENTLAAMTYDEVPLDELVRELKGNRDPARNPLYDVMFSLEPPLAVVDQRWNLTQVEVETGAAKLDLYFELDERADGITGKLMYKTDLFSPDAAASIVSDYLAVLRTVVADPFVKIAELVLPTDVRQSREERPVLASCATHNGSDARLEATLLQLWRSVLCAGSMGRRDNFFHLGGHSLLAIQLLAAVEQQFGARLNFSELLQAPTVQRFAQVLRQRMSTAVRSNATNV